MKEPKDSKMVEQKRSEGSDDDDDEEFTRMFSSPSPDGTDTEDFTTDYTTTDTEAGQRKYRSNVEELRRHPPLIISPLFSYLAMLALKLPIPLMDIYGYILFCNDVLIVRWIKTGQIPYTRADRLIPPQMLKRLRGVTRIRFVVNVFPFTNPGYKLTTDQTRAPVDALLDERAGEILPGTIRRQISLPQSSSNPLEIRQHFGVSNRDICHSHARCRPPENGRISPCRSREELGEKRRTARIKTNGTTYRCVQVGLRY